VSTGGYERTVLMALPQERTVLMALPQERTVLMALPQERTVLMALPQERTEPGSIAAPTAPARWPRRAISSRGWGRNEGA
jgi:hypothetical protein